MDSLQAPIVLDGVTKDCPGVRALDNVSLSVREGENCCLLGPNGAGKTTIIRLLQGALRPTSGAVHVLGADTGRGELIEAKRRIGVVPQSPGFYPDLTVREYLEFVRGLYGRGDPVATARAYDLEPYLDRALAHLSGGTQRRLLVASAVLTEPSILLLDEPTVGLDPLAAAQTRALLREAVRGRTVLMSTHNLAEAEELCETVIIVRSGRVLVHERIDELRRQTLPRVHLRIQQGPETVEPVLEGRGLSWTRNGAGYWLTVEQPERAVPAVLRGLLAEGLDVFECRIVPASLEDLFVRVVTGT